MKFEDRLTSAQADINRCLESTLAEFSASQLLEAIDYSLTGGKRVRGFLVVESAAVFGVQGEGPTRAAAAIECMHAYSLVHDDLPCMDDDDVRRGKPSLHVAFNETMAVLAGDALQTMAFQLISDRRTSTETDVLATLTFTLAKAAGANGMVLGQNLDLNANEADQSPSVEDILFLQSKKTGALLSWSAQAGAILAGEDTGPLKEYADCVGLAYQISDDLLDAANKESEGANLLNALGASESRKMAEKQIAKACDALAVYGKRADTLVDLATFVLARDH